MTIFAKVDCSRERMAYFAGKSLDSIREDLQQNFPKEYDLSTLTQIKGDEIIKYYRNKFGEDGITRGCKEILAATLSINKGNPSFCINHLKKERRNRIEIL